MKLKFLLVFALILPFTFACSDDDTTTTTTTPVQRVSEARFTLNGTEYITSTLIADYDDPTLDIVATFSGGQALEFSMSPIPAVGLHTTNLTLGFAVVTDNAWFCSSNCQVEVLEHDAQARWFSAKISGTLDVLFGSQTALLNEARVKVLY